MKRIWGGGHAAHEDHTVCVEFYQSVDQTVFEAASLVLADLSLLRANVVYSHEGKLTLFSDRPSSRAPPVFS